LASGFVGAQDYMNDLDHIKYFDADSTPPATWKSIDFDDAPWKDGYGFIGYGDPVDLECRHTTSLYTRSYFDITDPSVIEAISIVIDFDDGFAAYINGVEIARVNLGKFYSATTQNQLADRSHEMELYRNFEDAVICYYIDKDFITNHIIAGRNVLSIEVHNDSVAGSDLGTIGVMFDVSNQEYNIYNFVHRYKRSIQLDSTLLPILKIETGEYGITSKHLDVDAKMGIINKGSGNYNKPDDSCNEYNGNIQIEIRGESSSDFPKKPYDIELKDNQGKDTSVALLGMPRESDWILQGPFADKSQIRNALVYDWGMSTGHWTPRVKFCEVILDGEFIGLYNLIEKIKRDTNRVYVAKLNPDEISGINMTGGYIVKYDKGDNRLQVVYPKESDLQPEQLEYIRNFVKGYEGKLLSNDGLDPEKGYKKYIDPQSLIDYMIVVELTKNCDSYLFSSYMYKDRDDRDPHLKYGPLWDFDLSMGNSVWQEGYKTEGWQFAVPTNFRFRIKRLLEDPEMVDLFRTRWHKLRSEFLSNESIFNQIDSMTTVLADPIKRNYQVWPVEDKGPFFPYYIMPTYADEIQYVKDWLTARIAWIDDNIDGIYYPVTDYSGVEDQTATEEFSSNIYPNPFNNEFYMNLNLPVSGNLNIQLIDIQGRVVATVANTIVEKGEYKVYWKNNGNRLNQGLYIISTRVNGELFNQEKVFCSGK
jgi:hypothetical protein